MSSQPCRDSHEPRPLLHRHPRSVPVAVPACEETAVSEMDVRTARVLQEWLEIDYPGTVWEVTLEGPNCWVTLEASTGQVLRADPERVDDKAVRVAA